MSTFTPISISPAEPNSSRRLPSLHDFFSPGGLLAKSSLAFEHRPGQYEMAKAVERALTDKRHLIVEAGTGTGKTLAYLLPQVSEQAGREALRVAAG
jgi:ATP-dependent DNA helicase DinG